MLNVFARPPASQGKEQEPAPPVKQIFPSESGTIEDKELMGGVSIETIRCDQEGTILNIHFMKSEYDAWIGGVKNGSMINLATSQIASDLLNGRGLPSDFDERITLTNFNLPKGVVIGFSAMQKTGDKNIPWRKLSDVQLYYTPEAFR